jgi:hypothetical protein
MTSKSVLFMLAASLLASACNQAKQTSESSTATSEAVITVEGINPAELRSALFAVSDVEILADGRELDSSLDRASAGRARGGDKLSLRFSVPARARQIEVRLGFDEFGGYDGKAGKAGEIDARGTRIRFEVPARELAESGHASVRLDLARSLVPTRPGRLVLLPHFELLY